MPSGQSTRKIEITHDGMAQVMKVNLRQPSGGRLGLEIPEEG
jgi:hypothetical protein